MTEGTTPRHSPRRASDRLLVRLVPDGLVRPSRSSPIAIGDDSDAGARPDRSSGVRSATTATGRPTAGDVALVVEVVRFEPGVRLGREAARPTRRRASRSTGSSTSPSGRIEVYTEPTRPGRDARLTRATRATARTTRSRSSSTAARSAGSPSTTSCLDEDRGRPPGEVLDSAGAAGIQFAMRVSGARHRATTPDATSRPAPARSDHPRDL